MYTECLSKQNLVDQCEACLLYSTYASEVDSSVSHIHPSQHTVQHTSVSCLITYTVSMSMYMSHQCPTYTRLVTYTHIELAHVSSQCPTYSTSVSLSNMNIHQARVSSVSNIHPAQLVSHPLRYLIQAPSLSSTPRASVVRMCVELRGNGCWCERGAGR